MAVTIVWKRNAGEPDMGGGAEVAEGLGASQVSR